MEEKKENIVKKVCRELNLKPSELAQKIDVPPTTLANWRAGRIPKIAEVAFNLMIENKEKDEVINQLKLFKKMLNGLK